VHGLNTRTNIQQQSQGTWGRRVKKKHNQERTRARELLNAQDTVLCSYFAQRSGERGEGRSRKSTVEESFQGLDNFE
jgi:hypothetical protein